MTTRTITFGDVAENGPGMEHIGKASGIGLTRSDLEEAKRRFEARGVRCELNDLISAAWEDVPNDINENRADFESACLLVIRGG